MTEEIKKGRSPSAPRITLEEGIELTKKLHKKAGKSSLPPVVAVQALDYAGLNGAALGILAALKHYGLLVAERGTSVAVSQLALHLIHPLNQAQELSARREAALNPKEFADLYASGHHACSVDVLANHLIQGGFTPDGAKRAASVFKANEEFAKLNEMSSNERMISEAQMPTTQQNPQRPTQASQRDELNIETRGIDTRQRIRDYRFLLDGENEVELRFFGEVLGRDQVQGLIDYLEVMMKRLAREGDIRPTPPEEPEP